MNDYINLFEQTIEEAYVGKSNILLEIEDQIGVMRNAIKIGQNMNSNPEVQKLNRLFEKQFGMDLFSLEIIPKDEIDAYTYSLSKSFDFGIKKNISKYVVGTQESGYKFKANNGICIIVAVSYGILKSNKFSNEEITAMFLHEIGHNFADCLNDAIHMVNRKLIKNYYNYLIWKGSCIFGRKYRKEVEDRMNKNKYTKAEKEKTTKFSSNSWIKKLIYVKYNFVSFAKETLYILTNKKAANMQIDQEVRDKQNDKMSKSLGRMEETFADKFAAVYGYAIPLTKGLFKLDPSVIESPAYKFVDKFNKDANDAIEKALINFYLFDMHPAEIQRANAMMNTLKNELDKEDIDPNVKKVLKGQISELDKYLKEMTTASKNDSEREAIRKAFYKTVSKEAPDGLCKELEQCIEDSLEAGLNKST